MTTHEGINPEDMKWDTEEQPYDAELDRVRRQWRLDRELAVTNFEGLPIPCRLSRYLGMGESGPAAYIGYDDKDPLPRPPILFISTEYLDTKRGVLKLVSALAKPEHLNNEEMAWALANHAQELLGVEREKWIGEYKKDDDRAAAMLGRKEAEIQKLSGGAPAAAGMLGDGSPPVRTDDDGNVIAIEDGRRPPGVTENG